MSRNSVGIVGTVPASRHFASVVTWHNASSLGAGCGENDEPGSTEVDPDPVVIPSGGRSAGGEESQSSRPGGHSTGRMAIPRLRAFAALRFHELCCRLQGRPTLQAELGGGPHLLATTGAELHERCPALFTELGSLGILKPTAHTTHAASLPLRALRDKRNAGAYPQVAIGCLVTRAEVTWWKFFTTSVPIPHRFFVAAANCF